MRFISPSSLKNEADCSVPKCLFANIVAAALTAHNGPPEATLGMLDRNTHSRDRRPEASFIKVAKVPVYPVEEVFLAEIRGKDDQLYALDATK